MSSPGKLITMQPFKRKCFFNCKINARTGFLDPENMGKGTQIDFLSQILTLKVLVATIDALGHFETG